MKSVIKTTVKFRIVHIRLRVLQYAPVITRSNPHTSRAAFALRALMGSLLSYAVASPRFISLLSLRF